MMDTTAETAHPKVFHIWASEGTFWERLIEPHPDITSASDRRRARLLSAVMLPLIPTFIIGLLVLWLFHPPLESSLLSIARSIGTPLFILYGAAYLISRTPLYEMGAYLVVTATEVSAWLAIALSAGQPTVGMVSMFLLVAVLFAAIFLSIEAVSAMALLNGTGTLLLPYVAGLGPTELYMVFAMQAVAYPFLIASAWVQRRDLITIQGQAREIETVLDSIPDTVISVDGDLRLLGVNRDARARLHAWFGQLPERGLDLHTSDLMPAAIMEQLHDAIRNAEAERGKVTFQVIGFTTEVGLRDFEFVVNPQHTHEGEHSGYVVLVSDITERNAALRLERKTHEQSMELKKLEEMNQFKTQLLNTASHELRTPLTPIRLQLGALRQDKKSPLADHQLHALDMLDRNTQRLERLVADILDVTRIEGDQLKLVLQPVEICTLVADEVENLQPVAENAGVTLTMTPTGVEDLFVEGDPIRIGQVISNLLGNAIKFTPEGNINVSCQLFEDRVRILINDDGLGMDPDAISRLFHPFSQIHDETRLAVGGSGLGLYICKGIIEAHGGQIAAKSEGLGHGSTFWFEVPLSSDQE